MRPEAQYIDPRPLLLYREHAWSREYNRCGPAAWDELCRSVLLEGFREPAILSYNHSTGEAYFGEGNHRIGVAVELRLHVPVIIFRSQMTSAERPPMKPLTAPGRYSMRDDWGFSRFPEVARPEVIGLAVIPLERVRGVVPPEVVAGGERELARGGGERVLAGDGGFGM